MRLIANLKHILAVYVTETVESRLQIVYSLTHIALSGEDNRLEAIVSVAKLLELANLEETLQDLLVRQTRIPQNGTARLDWLNDLLRVVASQTETSGARVDFHDSSQSLLCPVT